MTSCVPPKPIARNLLVAADRDAMGIADRLALRVERERVIRDRAVERDARQALAENPAQIDVVPGRRETGDSACWRCNRSCRRR